MTFIIKTLETLFVFKVSITIFATSKTAKMKEKILDKSSEMFLTYGFKSITMDDIAEKMSISKKTIYTHFSNKTKLIEETISKMFLRITNGIDCICKRNNNPIEEIFQIKNFMMENLKDEKSSPLYQLEKYYPKIHKSLMQKQFGVMRGCVSENIRRGVEDGYFRKKIDVDFISRIYFKGMTGIKDIDTFPSETYEMKYLMENYIDYHVRGIATEKGIQTLEKIKSQYN